MLALSFIKKARDFEQVTWALLTCFFRQMKPLVPLNSQILSLGARLLILANELGSLSPRLFLRHYKEPAEKVFPLCELLHPPCLLCCFSLWPLEDTFKDHVKANKRNIISQQLSFPWKQWSHLQGPLLALFYCSTTVNYLFEYKQDGLKLLAKDDFEFLCLLSAGFTGMHHHGLCSAGG